MPRHGTGSTCDTPMLDSPHSTDDGSFVHVAGLRLCPSLDLVEPPFPTLYIGCEDGAPRADEDYEEDEVHDDKAAESSTPISRCSSASSVVNAGASHRTSVPEFDVVVLLYGSPHESIEQRLIEARLADASFASDGGATCSKVACPSLDIFVNFFAARQASSRLRRVLASLLPLSLPFQFHGIPASFNASVIEPLARERQAELVHYRHQQWARLPITLPSDSTSTDRVELAEEAEKKKTQQEQQSDTPLVKPSPVTPGGRGGSESTNSSSRPAPRPTPPPFLPSEVEELRTNANATPAVDEQLVGPISAGLVLSPSNAAAAGSHVRANADDAAVAPVSVVVAPLRPEHASLVARWWPYTTSSTSRVLPFLLADLPTACVYVDSEPVSWALTQTYGGIGMLHTQPAHRGRGYARLAIDFLCAQLRSQGRSPFCYIHSGNGASQKVFRSLDFTRIHDCDWIVWVPRRYDATLVTPGPRH